MRVDEIDFYNRLLNYRDILYLCHRNADPDAVSSAFALSEAIGGTVGLVDGCNRVASLLIEKLDIEVVESPNFDEYEFILVVDTSTISQLNGLKLMKYGVIDHHATTALTENAEFYLHKHASSTAEIVFSVLKCMEAPVMPRVALGLLTGIVTDTGHFKHANSETFSCVSEIIKLSGVDYAEVIDLMASTPQDISIRIAMLKAAARADTERTGDWLISTSYVSSFGGSAASMLINIGADVSFVGTSHSNSTTRISGRAKREAVNAGVNLGQIMENISANYDGTGGGHAGAAGIDVNSDMNEILNECKMHVIDILKHQENPSNL